MTTSGPADRISAFALRDPDGGGFSGMPAISETTGQAPRFSCIYDAPASCSLKSALISFSRAALEGRQFDLYTKKRARLRRKFQIGVSWRAFDFLSRSFAHDDRMLAVG
jgi:hypothetical protein